MPPSCSPDSSGIRQKKTTRTPSSPSRTRLQAKRWHASILLTVWLKAVAPSKPCHYSAQEFLDREYDYKLDFFLQGNQWKYVQLSISILDWSKRIQRVDF